MVHIYSYPLTLQLIVTQGYTTEGLLRRIATFPGFCGWKADYNKTKEVQVIASWFIYSYIPSLMWLYSSTWLFLSCHSIPGGSGDGGCHGILSDSSDGRCHGILGDSGDHVTGGWFSNEANQTMD
jgi:hypothetical protein